MPLTNREEADVQAYASGEEEKSILKERYFKHPVIFLGLIEK